MKKIFTSLTLLLFAVAAFAQAPQMPVDFESTTIAYTFNDFEGGAASVVDNPDASGINTSSKVGQMIKNEGAVFAGSTLPLDGIIDFGDNNAVKMKVRANRAGASILFKLETPGVTSTGDIFATTTVANQWEEVTFSLAGLTSVDYNTIVIIYELGTVGDGGPDFTFWFDDIELTTAEIDGIQLPIDFESTTLDYVWSDFGGGVASIIDNPDASGINTSSKVGQMIKFAGEDFGGSALNLAGAIDFGTTAIIKMKVWANRVGAPVLFKMEGPGAPVELSASTTVANEWEELTYDFTGMVETGIFNKVVIIYDLGVIGDGSADFTLYFDDIELATATGGVQIPIDFESTTLDYTWSDFGGGAATIIDNPDASGSNTSSKVGQMVKFAGEVFGGSTLALGGPIELNNYNDAKIVMKTWANREDASVLFKLEGSTPEELFDTTTVANQWEELAFDVSGLTGVYTGITIIYELGTVGDGGPDFTLYFDDIELIIMSSVVSLQDLGIEYFPNPVTDLMTVRAPQNIDEITVYNLLGQPVFFEKGFNTVNTIDLSALKPGAYFLKVASEGKEGSARIIVQ